MVELGPARDEPVQICDVWVVEPRMEKGGHMHGIDRPMDPRRRRVRVRIASQKPHGHRVGVHPGHSRALDQPRAAPG